MRVHSFEEELKRINDPKAFPFECPVCKVRRKTKAAIGVHLSQRHHQPGESESALLYRRRRLKRTTEQNAKMIEHAALPTEPDDAPTPTDKPAPPTTTPTKSSFIPFNENL